jgi:hypothetical protein
MALAILFGTSEVDRHSVPPHSPISSSPPAVTYPFPWCSRAALLRKRVFLHEQNALPGQANRRLARFAVRVGVSFESALEYFPPPKGRVTGYPVSRSLGKESRADARARLGIATDAQVLLVFGGSMGARSINRALIDCIKGSPTDNPRLLSSSIPPERRQRRTTTPDRRHDEPRGGTASLPPTTPRTLSHLPISDNLPRTGTPPPTWSSRAPRPAARVMELGTMGRALDPHLPKMDVPGLTRSRMREVLAATGGAEILDQQPARDNGLTNVPRVRGRHAQEDHDASARRRCAAPDGTRRAPHRHSERARRESRRARTLGEELNRCCVSKRCGVKRASCSSAA